MQRNYGVARDAASDGLQALSGTIRSQPLAAIFIYLVIRGIGSLNLAFFTQIPKPVGETGGGMANAIVGSVIILLIGSVIGVPLGVGDRCVCGQRQS